MSTQQPLFKINGGKTRLVPKLRAACADWLQAANAHEEPPLIVSLFGGALSFERVLYAALPRADLLIAERSPYLRHVYNAVRDQPNALMLTVNGYFAERELLRQARGFDGTRRRFYDTREFLFNDGAPEALDSVAAAAAYIYYNRTCHGGLLRVNKHGAPNVPIGVKGYDKKLSGPPLSTYVDYAEMLRDADVAETAEFLVGHLLDRTDTRRRPVFVFADPPYWQTESKYTAAGFDARAHEDLAADLATICEEIPHAHVMHTNSANDDVLSWHSCWADDEPVRLSLHDNFDPTDNSHGKKRYEYLFVRRGSMP